MQDKGKTEILGKSDAEIGKAGDLLADGGLVAFPTETVYGLGADATNDKAVAGIFAAKGRPSFNPLIVHVAALDDVERLAQVSDTARRLASAFWPGPLTLVLPLKDNSPISKLVTAGGSSLAIRVPSGDVVSRLLATSDRPIAAPSANPSGRISPTTAEHVLAGLSGQIDAVIDAGKCKVGVESTIVSLIGKPTLLRAGGLPEEALVDCLGEPLHRSKAGDTIEAPGQLASHYAPKARVRMDAETAATDEFYIGFGPVPGSISLSATGDLTEAAANLFATLHKADATGRPIAVAPIPEIGLGQAINDRLRRAAAPRG